ncbi:MAG TPA: Hsp20/alpha crystallin family protein [Candidatus Kapabacteria bacterium]|nr:Hsp20/alpha crystallin family protein [Candidatus Kapabacteria bacterium]
MSSTIPPSVFEMIVDTDGKQHVIGAHPSARSIPENWHADHQEGQLAVDVAETKEEIIVVSTMAGAETSRIEVYIHNDLLTIRGCRVSPLDEIPKTQYFCTECFWGTFSRTIVLPVHVKGDLAKAEYKNGVLMIRVPKRQTHAHIPVVVVDE